MAGTGHSLDLLYLAWNRREFTSETWRALMLNTDWRLVSRSVAYDDGSTDGTARLLRRFDEVRHTHFGTPVQACNDFVSRSRAEYVAKIDNDTMLPPGWLTVCMGIMERNPELELLGLENFGMSAPVADPEYGYEPADHVGGIFVARRRIFEEHPLPKPDGTYYGFTDWQRDEGIVRGWIKPAIGVFLLDRIPFDPWAALSAKYEARGWQRWWERYNLSMSDVWKWAFPNHA